MQFKASPRGRWGGGHGRGPETSKQPTGRPGPAGQGRSEQQRKYSSVRRESRGKSTVVRGKGEGGVHVLLRDWVFPWLELNITIMMWFVVSQ